MGAVNTRPFCQGMPLGCAKADDENRTPKTMASFLTDRLLVRASQTQSDQKRHLDLLRGHKSLTYIPASYTIRSLSYQIEV